VKILLRETRSLIVYKDASANVQSLTFLASRLNLKRGLIVKLAPEKGLMVQAKVADSKAKGQLT
jgi:hypothetical protein